MLTNNTFRLFVSSTFSDFIAERDALQTRVFKRLEKYCAERGARFQAVDLRWGITEDIQRQHDTLRICLEEIRRCQVLSPRPNFVALLGDRYGWEPVPARIPLDHWNQLKEVASADQFKLIDAEYQLDANAVPPIYCLRPQTKKNVITINREKSLLQALHSAAKHFIGSDRLPYFASATHQEIVLGALDDKDSQDHVYVYVRRIADMPNNVSAQEFIDWDSENEQVDQEARNKLRKLESELRQRLEGRVCDMQAHWDANGGGVDEAYLDQFCEMFYQHQITLIDTELQLVEDICELDERQKAHANFGIERSRVFVGREQLLSNIFRYTNTQSEDICRPVILLGKGGEGKSALLAKAVEYDRKQLMPSQAVIVERYIGGVPGTESLMAFLTSIMADLANFYSQPTPAIPVNTKDLAEGLFQALNYATAERPLHLYLDALDQLNSQDEAWLLEWLPKELPEYAKVVATVRIGTPVEKSARQRYLETIIEVLPLSLNEGQAMLDAWLADTKSAWFSAGNAPTIGRKLTAKQRKTVLNTFSQNGSALWLKLAYEEVCNWTSWDKARTLPVTLTGMIEDLIDYRLLQRESHPKVFTERALAYLTAGRFGVSEDELARVMATDETVRNEFQANERTQRKWGHENKLPPVLWSRLYFDLQPYLGLAKIDGALLMRWFHREFSEVLQEKYLASAENQQMIHGGLADTFQILERELRLNETNDDALFRATDAGGAQVSAALRRVMEQPWQLAQAGKQQDLQVLLTDFGFCMGKCAANLVTDFEDNYRASVILRGSSSLYDAWFGLVQEQSHLLLSGSAQWPAHKILLQVAIEQADDDLVTLAAKTWLNHGYCDWIWMRQINRPKRAQASPLVAVMRGHSEGIYGVAILSGERAISWSYDKTIVSWDLMDGSLKAKLNTLTDSIGGLNGASMLSDNQIFCWSDIELQLWDIKKNSQISKLMEPSKLISGAFSLNSREILYWGHWGTNIWCPKLNTTRMVPLSLETQMFNSLELDENRFVNYCNNKLQVIAKDTLQPEFELFHNDEVLGVTAIDKKILCSWSKDRIIKFWNALTGGFEFEFHVETVLSEIRVLDAQTLAGWCSTRGNGWSNSDSIFIISIPKRCVIQELVGHNSFIANVLRLSDGRLVSASGDTTFRIWYLFGNKYTPMATIGGHNGPIKNIKLMNNGFVLSMSDDNTLRIWNFDNIKQVHSESTPDYINDYLSLSSGAVVLVTDYYMHAWPPSDSDPVVSMTAGDGEKIINAIASSDGNVIFASGIGLIQNWNPISGDMMLMINCGERANLQMLDDRRFLVIGSQTIQVWDFAKGQRLQTLQVVRTGKILPLSVSRLLIPSNESLDVWDLESGECIKQLISLHNNFFWGEILSPDFLVTVCNKKNTVTILHIWDLESLELKLEFIAPELIAGIRRLSDGRVVFWGRTLLWVFDPYSLETPFELQGHLGSSGTASLVDMYFINGCIELSDGRFLTYSSDCTIRIWTGKESVCQLIIHHSIGQVKELPGRRLLTYTYKTHEMIIWCMDSGEIIERAELDWLQQTNLLSKWINNLPDAIKNRKVGVTRWTSLWAISFPRDYLLVVYKGTPLRWYSTDYLREPLCANGNAILAVSSWRVYRLGLWHGRNRIDIELETVSDDASYDSD